MLLGLVALTAFFMVVCNNAIRSIQAQSKDSYASIVSNYIVAFLLAVIYCLLKGTYSGSYFNAVTIGIFTGFFYTAALFIIIPSMGQRGMALTGALAGTALLVPVLFAIILGERPTHQQTAGIFTAAAAMPFLSLSTVSGLCIREKPRLPLAISLFLIQGTAMSGNLIASKLIVPASLPLYLVSLYGSGLVFSLCFWTIFGKGIVGKGVKKKDIQRGALFGLFNIAGTLLIVTSLTLVPGAIFFTATSIVNLTFTTLAAIWFWHERMQILGWVGLILAVTAAPLLILK